MKYAGAQAEKICAKPPQTAWAYLLFGPDNGIISDQAKCLCDEFSKTHGPVEIIRMSDDEIRKDPARLFDALEAVSLLGEQQIIRIQTSGDKIAKLLLEAIAAGETQANRYAARLLITCGALAKRSKLRTTVEDAKHAIALHFYEDDQADIIALVRRKLNEDKVEIEEEALMLFAADLPGHRSMANSEIEKLALYGYGLGRALTVADIQALSTTESEQGLHDLIGATLAGDIRAAFLALDRLSMIGTSPISVLRGFQREAQRMLSAHMLAGQGGEVGMKLKPPVFKQAWPAFRARLSVWSPKRLARLLERIYDAEHTTRQAGPVAHATTRKLIADLANVASRARR